jgi:hypothetical protein
MLFLAVSFVLGNVGNGSGRCEKVQKRYRSLYSSGLSIYRMTRPNWPLRHRADSGPGLSGFPIGNKALDFTFVSLCYRRSGEEIREVYAMAASGRMQYDYKQIRTLEKPNVLRPQPGPSRQPGNAPLPPTNKPSVNYGTKTGHTHRPVEMPSQDFSRPIYTNYVDGIISAAVRFFPSPIRGPHLGGWIRPGHLSVALAPYTGTSRGLAVIGSRHLGCYQM